MGDTRHEIPFAISPSNGARLAVQAADGFRKAILSGYYRPGDVLPTFRELAKMLGTSIRIPIEAFKILSAEGLVVSRQGSGSVNSPSSATGFGLETIASNSVLAISPRMRTVAETSDTTTGTSFGSAGRGGGRMRIGGRITRGSTNGRGTGRTYRS